jgi:hypothetical protein
MEENSTNDADDNFSGLGYATRLGRLLVGTTVARSTYWYPIAPFGAGTRINNSAASVATAPRDYASIINAGNAEPVFGVVAQSIYRWDNFWGAVNNGTITTSLPNDCRGITSRSNKYLIVASYGAHRLRMILTNGVTVSTQGSYGYGDTNFWAPTGVAWDSANDLVWVSDTSNQRLVCYRIVNNQFQFVRKVETSPYLTRNPQGMWIDDYGNLFVVDNGGRKVKKYDSFGNPLMEIGGPGWSNGYFINPLGVTVDPQGFIYVTDHAKNNIQKFSNNGKYAMKRSVNQPRAIKCYGTNIFVAKNNEVNAWDDGILGLNFSLQSNSWWWSSWADDNADDFARDNQGYFYLSDFANANQDKFFPRQNLQGKSNGYINTGTGGGIVIDDYDTVWIVRRGNNDVRSYATNTGGGGANINLFNFGSAGSGDGQFNAPTMCAIRVRNLPGNWADFWVNDAGNNRLQKFIINWGSEGSVQTTIANAGRPQVTKAYPDEIISTNVNYYAPEAQYYVRQGKSTFKVLFSQGMNTNLKPTVEYITADSTVYTITRSSYINNIWIGTAWIPTGKDGAASIRVQNAFNSSGSNINPNPTILANAFIIDTTPPVINLTDPTYNYVTAMTSIQVKGITDPGIRVDVYNYQASSGTIVVASATNQYSDGTGYFMIPSLKLRTPKDSTNFITARAVDKAGNWSSFIDPRRLVRCIVAVGYAYVLPSTNRRLGDKGLSNPPFQLVWQANAAFGFGTVTFDVPSGWAAPDTNRASPGYVRVIDSSGMTFTTGKTLRTGVVPGRLKVNFDAAALGAYFKIGYGTNTQTMVSNSYSTAIGMNEWVAKATNHTSSCTNIWYPPKKVGEYTGQSLSVPVLGKPMRLSFSNKMPAQTYRGAFNVRAMRLFLVNSNAYHTNQVNTIRLTVLNAANVLVDANTRLSSISLYTNGALYVSSAALNSPYVQMDLSTSPFLIPPGKTNKIDVQLNISAVTVATDVKIRLASSGDISAVNYKNSAAVSIPVVGSFPLTSTHAKINAYLMATRMFTSLSNRSLGWVEASEVDFLPAKFHLVNTNTNVNDVEITRVYFRVENRDGTGIVPNTLITQASVKKWNTGITYASKPSVESTGFQIAFDTIGLYIPSKSSVTLQLNVGIKSNTAVSNFQLVLSGQTNVKARDRIQYSTVTNFAYPGFVFPMRTRNIEVVRYFRVEHDKSATVSVWEPVVFKALNVNRNPVTNYSGIVTVDAVVGTAATISWMAKPSANGILVDLGPVSSGATYAYAKMDRGIVTLMVSDSTVETIDLRMRSLWRAARSNHLAVFSLAPNVLISKRARVTNHPSYIALGGSMTDVVPGSMLIYMITYTNLTAGVASNVLFRDMIRTNTLRYKAGSIRVNGISNSDILDGLDTSDYGVTMPNTVTVTLKKILGNAKGQIEYRVYVK